jgi:hypothetical protein
MTVSRIHLGYQFLGYLTCEIVGARADKHSHYKQGNNRHIFPSCEHGLSPFFQIDIGFSNSDDNTPTFT